MFKIWCIEADGDRVLVRDDVSDAVLARALLTEGNNGARIRGEAHRYVAEPDPTTTAPIKQGLERPRGSAMRIAERKSDMGPGKLRVGYDSENDIVVTVEGDRGRSGSVEFCRPGLGGGASRRTLAALATLIEAMEADNRDPSCNHRRGDQGLGVDI